LSGYSRLRNRVIGRVFRELKLIEQWGSGLQRIIETCKKMGLQDPLFEEEHNQFRITLFSLKKRKILINRKVVIVLSHETADLALSVKKYAAKEAPNKIKEIIARRP